MSKIKRSDIVNLINPTEWVNQFENKLDTKIEGWIILWNGEMVKPLGGNSYYYASKESALASIERNIDFSTSIVNDICLKKNGFIYYNPSTQKLQGQYDKDWVKYYMQEEYTAHWKLDSRKRKEIETENSPEYQLMISRRQEWDLIQTVAGNAVKSVLVPAWIKEGKLQFKQI